MKRYTPAFPALVSALLVALSPALTARPRYGGTLRVEISGAVAALDPARFAGSGRAEDVLAPIVPLAFETLTVIDAGALRPLLAVSWESDAQSKRWQFRIRSGVKLHDGTVLTPAHVASALGQAEPGWTVVGTTDTVTLQCARSTPGLEWQLAAPRYAVAVAGSGGLPAGTGPFRIDRLEPGRRLALAAHDDYWGGRPFLDGIAIEMGRASREQATSLELGRADVVSVLPQDARRLSQRGVRIVASRPRELVALVFNPASAFATNDRARSAVAMAVDRAAICNVLLQHEGQPASSLLPAWLSGYAALFPLLHDRSAARSLIAALPSSPRAPTLAFDPGDPLAQGIADRIVVDLRETGMVFTLVPHRASAARQQSDMRLVRLGLEAAPVEQALAALLASTEVATIGGTNGGTVASVEDAYRVEHSIVERHLIVPLVHLPTLYGLAPRVQVPMGLITPSGRLNLAEAWLFPEKP